MNGRIIALKKLINAAASESEELLFREALDKLLNNLKEEKEKANISDFLNRVAVEEEYEEEEEYANEPCQDCQIIDAIGQVILNTLRTDDKLSQESVQNLLDLNLLRASLINSRV